MWNLWFISRGCLNSHVLFKHEYKSLNQVISLRNLRLKPVVEQNTFIKHVQKYFFLDKWVKYY